MFTFGIFSTHLPYIAFVLFYGFFFLFGIEKASAGELGEGRQIIPKVVTMTADNLPDIDVNDVSDCNCLPWEPDYEQLLLYEKKEKLFCFVRTSLIKSNYCFSWFSRPPPVA